MPVAFIGEFLLFFCRNNTTILAGLLLGGFFLIDTVVFDCLVYGRLITAVGCSEKHDTVSEIIKHGRGSAGNKLPVISLLYQAVSTFSYMQCTPGIPRKRIDSTNKPKT